jgi:hypothetical protein
VTYSVTIKLDPVRLFGAKIGFVGTHHPNETFYAASHQKSHPFLACCCIQAIIDMSGKRGGWSRTIRRHENARIESIQKGLGKNGARRRRRSKNHFVQIVVISRNRMKSARELSG